MICTKSNLLTRAIGKYYYTRTKAYFEGTESESADKQEELRIFERFARENAIAEGKSKDRNSAHHPSSFEDCPRKKFFKFFRLPVPWSGTWTEISTERRIFSMGDMIHLRFQVLFEMMGILRAREYKISAKKFGVRGFEGSADAVVELGGEIYVVEIKSLGAGGVGYLHKNGPHESYKTQSVLYLHTIAEQLERRNNRGLRSKIPSAPVGTILLYEEKGTAKLHEFLIRSDKDDYDELIRRAHEFDNTLAAKKIPPIPTDFEPTSFPCSFCDYPEICYKPKAVKRWLSELLRQGGAKKTKRKTFTFVRKGS